MSGRRVSRSYLAAASLALIAAVACGGGSNLPSVSRTVALPTLPSRTATLPTGAPSEPTTPTSEPTAPPTTRTTTTPPPTTEPPTTKTTTTTTAPPTTQTTTTTPPPTTATSPTAVPSSPTSATTSSTSPWLWILLALAVIAVIVAFVLRNASQKRAARADAHRRALQASTAAMALRDRAAVLPMSPDADRARLLSDLSADLDRVEGEFQSLRADPALQDASAEIDAVLLSLTDLRGAIAGAGRRGRGRRGAGPSADRGARRRAAALPRAAGRPGLAGRATRLIRADAAFVPEAGGRVRLSPSDRIPDVRSLRARFARSV